MADYYDEGDDVVDTYGEETEDESKTYGTESNDDWQTGYRKFQEIYKEKFSDDDTSWRYYRHQRTIDDFFDDMFDTILENCEIKNDDTYENLEYAIEMLRD